MGCMRKVRGEGLFRVVGSSITVMISIDVMHIRGKGNTIDCSRVSFVSCHLHAYSLVWFQVDNCSNYSKCLFLVDCSNLISENIFVRKKWIAYLIFIFANLSEGTRQACMRTPSLFERTQSVHVHATYTLGVRSHSSCHRDNRE